MKKSLLVVLAVLCIIGIVTAANASLAMYEGFNYDIGPIGVTAAGSVSLGNWTTHSGTVGQISTLSLLGDVSANTSLTYPGLALSTGRRVYNDTAFSEDVNRTFPAIVPPGNVYCSMLVKCTLAPTVAAGDYFTHFCDGPASGGAFRSRVFAKATTGGVTYSIGWGSSTNNVAASYTGIYSLNTTHLIVYKIAMANGVNADTATLWVDPPSNTFGGAEPIPYATVTSSGPNSSGSINISTAGIPNVSIRNGGANHGSFEIDEIRVGTSWADVTPPGIIPVNISPAGPVNLNPGGSQPFTASGGSGTYTWSLSTGIYGSINTTAGNAVTFTASSAGTVTLTVNDGSQNAQVTINIVPTSAPLFRHEEGLTVQDKREIKF